MLASLLLFLSLAHARDPASLQAVVNDSPVRFEHAMTYSTGGESLYLTLSTHPLECAGVSGGRSVHGGEVSLTLLLSRRLSSDGSQSWQVANLGHANLNLYEVGAVDVSVADEAVAIGLQLAGDERLGSRRLQYALNGHISAEHCGVLPRSAAKPVPQPALTVQVAGRRIAIQGATLSDATLRLSDVPHACGESTSGAGIAMSVQLNEDGTARSLRLTGTQLASPQIANLGPVFSQELALGPLGEDGEITKVGMDGNISAGAYAVKIGGTARVTRCSED